MTTPANMPVKQLFPKVVSLSGTNSTATAQPTRPQRIKAGSVPAALSMALVVADGMLMLIVWFAAGLLTQMVERFALGTAPYTIMQDSANTHRHIYMALCTVLILMCWSKGLYSRRKPWWSQVRSIGKACLTIVLIDGFMGFALKIYASRLLIALDWSLVFAAMVGARWVVWRMAQRFDWWRIPTVIIGDNATVMDLIGAFHSDSCSGYDIQTAFLRDKNSRTFDRGCLPKNIKCPAVVNGSALDFNDYIEANQDYFYVIAVDAFRGEMRETLLETLHAQNISYAIVPAMGNIGLYENDPYYFFGHDIMLLQPNVQAAGEFTVSKMLKRVFDVVISLIALAILSPLFLLVALCLKLEGQGGSLFYNGSRIGKNGKAFGCWKFRSMEPGSEHLLNDYLEANPLAKANWETYRKLAKDPRITTRTAALIRKFSIDELPQLWNVLKGDMSLVGPRPILAEEIHYFGSAFREYTSVRPGITGLWQVSGRNNASFARRVQWDGWYVRNWSLWGDMIILIKTPFVMLSRKGAH